MKSVNDRYLVVIVLTTLLLLFVCVMKAHSAGYEFRGAYPVNSIMANVCKNCKLDLPADYLQSTIVLAVETDSLGEFVEAVKASSRAIGWDLSKTQDGYRARLSQNVDMRVYVSCVDRLPKNVPSYMYVASIRSDSLLCAIRDSLEADQRAQHVRDSLKADSLSNLAPLDFRNYEIRYYAYTKQHMERFGVDWQQTLAGGNVRGNLHFFDNWTAEAVHSTDTGFTYRQLEFAVDSSISLDWGSETQTLKQTFVNDGVTTQDYEWRKYGMIVSVRRDGQRVHLSYTFRDAQESESVLQGSAIGHDGDTLRVVGQYAVHRNVETGVPVLSNIPVIGYIFRKTETRTENRVFEVYLIPKGGKHDRTRIETGQPDSAIHP